jgi:hypothetical protein
LRPTTPGAARSRTSAKTSNDPRGGAGRAPRAGSPPHRSPLTPRWFLLGVLTTSYGLFGMLGISPLSSGLVEGFPLTRLQVRTPPSTRERLPS